MVATVQVEGLPRPRPRAAAAGVVSSRAIGPAPRVAARTYRRRRAVAAGLVVSVLVMVRVALGLLGGEALPASERPAPGAGPGAGPEVGIVHVVQPGDTFWSLATRIDPQADPRPLVDRLVAAHGSPTLVVGERILLPRP